MMPIEDVQFTAERWLQFWDNYKGLKHQRDAVAKLGEHIKSADPGLLTESSEWVVDWRGTSDIDNTWGGIEAAARKHGSRYPELVAAQWRLESGSGKHMSGRNNPFGGGGSALDGQIAADDHAGGGGQTGNPPKHGHVVMDVAHADPESVCAHPVLPGYAPFP